MKLFLNIIGVLVGLLGIWWILQGTGIVPVGFMARQMQWALFGLIALIAGFGLLVFANRRPKGDRGSDSSIAR